MFALYFETLSLLMVAFAIGLLIAWFIWGGDAADEA